MSVKLNFGIIGIGNWGKNLIRDFSKYGNIEKCTNTGNHKNIRCVKTNYPSIEYVSDTNKIFKRFYSNRPGKFGQHSGLGLNIVKNLVDLHNARIKASNRIDKKGASMEIIFPQV